MLKTAFRCLLALALLPAVSVTAEACSMVDAREVLLAGLPSMSAGRERPSGADRFDPCYLQLVPGAPEPLAPLVVAFATPSSDSDALDPNFVQTLIAWLSDRLDRRAAAAFARPEVPTAGHPSSPDS